MVLICLGLMGLERALNVLVPIFYRNIGEQEERQLSVLVLHQFGGWGGPYLGRWDRAGWSERGCGWYLGPFCLKRILGALSGL